MNCLTLPVPLHRALAMCLALVLAMLSACGGGASDPAPLQITQQPVSTSVVKGDRVSFDVVASGDGLSYQWQRSTDAAATWTDIAGATGASLVIAAVDMAMSGQQFRVTVTGTTGELPSSAATLTVTATPEPPVIRTNPGAQTVVEGADASFSVTATGTSLSYQWQSSADDKTWAVLSAATSATLTLNDVALIDNGRHFRVLVSNAGGSVPSHSAVLTVTKAGSAPVITTQPMPASVVAPQSASFTVVTAGVPAPTHQWQRSTDDGASFIDIAGATGASYTTPATSTAQSGERYRVRVSNPLKTIFSDVVVLNVGAVPVKPRITLQPGNSSVVVPAAATFTVAATGFPAPSIQWQLSTDGGTRFSNINGATHASYTTPASTLADNGRRYRALASNTAGSVASDAAVLSVSAAGPSPGSGGQCSPLLLVGNVVQVKSPNAANPSAMDTATYGVNGAVSFEGHSASEYQVTLALDAAPALTIKLYLAFDHQMSHLTAYGSTATGTATFGGTTAVSNSRAVFTPPFVSRQFALLPGESTGPQTSTQVVTETNTVNGVPLPPTTRTEVESSNTTFVGYETITVPAGTFKTCKFVVDTTPQGGTPTSRTHWVLAGYGVDIKASGGGIAQSILVNGVPLTHN